MALLESVSLNIIAYPARPGSASLYRAASLPTAIPRAQEEARAVEDGFYKSAKSKVCRCPDNIYMKPTGVTHRYERKNMSGCAGA